MSEAKPTGDSDPQDDSNRLSDEFDLQPGDSLIVAGQVVTVLAVENGEVVLELSDSFPFDSGSTGQPGDDRPPRRSPR